MVSLLRNATRMLLAATADRQATLSHLAAAYDAESMALYAIFDKADEFHTIVCLTYGEAGSFRRSSISDALLIRREPESVLCRLCSEQGGSALASVRPAPHTIIMRSIGDAGVMLDAIRADLGGTVGGYDECVENGTEDSTVVGLTDKPLNRCASLSDFHSSFLRIDGHYPTVRRELKMHAFGYVNSGIGNKDWHELEIRIFDSYGAYKLHYERLIEVLESLEMGLVLGESWSKDYPLALMAVEVYSLRFYTFMEPIAIKRVLLGLEHLADGRRVVDYDLYYKNKKVYWADILGRKGKASRDRATESLLSRDELYARLDEPAKARLAELEKAILRSRTVTRNA